MLTNRNRKKGEKTRDCYCNPQGIEGCISMVMVHHLLFMILMIDNGRRTIYLLVFSIRFLHRPQCIWDSRSSTVGTGVHLSFDAQLGPSSCWAATGFRFSMTAQ